jgi:excisionase family DNA binding protein
MTREREREMGDPPFSPKLLAKRWGCSPQFVHKLIRKGELKAFKLGEKLLRIPMEEVRRWESQPAVTSSESLADGWSSPPGGKARDDIAFASLMDSVRKRRQIQS